MIASQEYSIEAEDLQLGGPAALAAALAPDDTTQLAGLERSAILSALEKTGGHHQKTADLLGISRKTLGRKLKQYRAAAQEEDSMYVA